MHANPRLLALLGLAEKMAVPAAATAVALLIWEILTRTLPVTADFLPGPYRIFIEIWLEADRLPVHAATTACEIMASLAIAVCAAVPISLVIDAKPSARRIAGPLISALDKIPLVLLAPLFFIWLGYGIQTKLLICLLVCVIAIAQSLLSGLAALPIEMSDFLISAGARSQDRIFHVQLPASLPHLFAGMKKAAVLALMGSVIGEYVEAEKGLGFLVIYATARMDTPLLCASFAIMAAMILVILGVISIFERILIPWNFPPRVEQAAPLLPQ